MKQYELIVVVDGKATAAKKKGSLEKIEKLVKTLEGKITETLDWGVRDLAYPIKKFTQGAYTIFQLDLPAASARLVNERLRLEEDILRYLLVTKEQKVVRIRNRRKEVVTEEPNEQKS